MPPYDGVDIYIKLRIASQFHDIYVFSTLIFKEGMVGFPVVLG